MHGHAVVGEQGVQERAQNAPLWGPSFEDQRGGDVVTYPHHLGAARQEVQYPVAQGGVETPAVKESPQVLVAGSVSGTQSEQRSYLVWRGARHPGPRRGWFSFCNP